MLDKLTTEQQNPASGDLDRLDALGLVRLMNSEDRRVAEVIAGIAPEIARVAERVAQAFREGGRLIYVGAGTSGRLGVLDAAECPPTFNTPPGWVVGVIAGGATALTQAVEGAEDFPEQGRGDLESLELQPRDVVVGIATSGRTPYVLGALRYAREVGATTVGLTCNEPSELSDVCERMLAAVVGPEVISGSTRLKAGTATKMILNMITTAAMVLIGKTYGNLMVDLRATNQKLVHRSRRMVTQLTGLTPAAADELLTQCSGSVKLALATHLLDVPVEQAQEALARADGRLRVALEDNRRE